MKLKQITNFIVCSKQGSTIVKIFLVYLIMVTEIFYFDCSYTFVLQYIEKILQPLNKTQVIKLFLKTQEQTNNTINTLTEEIKEIHRSFKRLELEIVVVKKVNDAFVKQLSSVELQCGGCGHTFS